MLFLFKLSYVKYRKGGHDIYSKISSKKMKKIKILFLTIMCILFVGAAISKDAYAKEKSHDKICTKTERQYILQDGGLQYVSAKTKSRKGNSNVISEKLKKHIISDLKKTWDNFLPECNLAKYHISMDEIFTVIYAILNENSNYFYVDVGYAWGGNNNEVDHVEFSYTDTKEKIKEKIAAYDKAITQAVSGVDPTWSDFEKALYLNDYLAANCHYDETYSKYTAYNALVEGTAVCQGYSLAYQALLSRVGIICEVIGSGSLNHAWNLIKINGKLYHVDVTWNDPLGNLPGRAGHRFFMKSTEFMRSKEGGHLVEDDWTSSNGFDINSVNDTSYDCFANDMDTAFVYSNGKWYNYDGVDSIVEYQYSDDKFIENKTVITINDEWGFVTDSGYYSYWLGKHVGYTAYDGKIYYSTSNKICLLNIEDGTSSVIFELSDYEDKYGCIWNISSDENGTLYYYWKKGEDSELKKTALVLDKSENVQNNFKKCYTICFDGNEDDITSDIMPDMQCLTDTSYELLQNKFTKSGYIFTGWNTKADGTGMSYCDKETIENLVDENYGNITLYAQWKQNEVIKPEETVKPEETSKPEETVTPEKTATPEETAKHKNYKNTKKIKKGKKVTVKIPDNTKKVVWKIILGKKYIKVIKKTKSTISIKGIKKGTAIIQGTAENKVLRCTIKISNKINA